jgi:hypothetical protein
MFSPTNQKLARNCLILEALGSELMKVERILRSLERRVKDSAALTTTAFGLDALLGARRFSLKMGVLLRTEPIRRGTKNVPLRKPKPFAGRDTTPKPPALTDWSLPRKDQQIISSSCHP